MMERLRACSRSSWIVAGVYLLVLAVLIDLYWGSKVDKKRMIAQGDGHITYLALRSLVIDHDIDFSNDAKRFDAWREKRSPTGRIVMPLSSMGPVFVWSPVMGLAHGVSKIANFFGTDIESHGYTYFHQRFVFRLLRRICGRSWARCGN